MRLSTGTKVEHAAVFVPTADPGANTAYRLLHIPFGLIPILTGVDKWIYAITDWDTRVSQALVQLFQTTPTNVARGMGVVEIVLGLLVLIRPVVGAKLLAIMLFLSALNSFVLPWRAWDVAIRDFALAVAALALAALAKGRARAL